jgi:tetratricopeptide (TPR) repeat protein
MRQFDLSGDEVLINDAIYLQRLALEQLSEAESQSKHRHLHLLSHLLTEKRAHWGVQNDDSDDILSILTEAFQLCPPMHVDRWEVHSQMVGKLLAEYLRSPKLELLNKAIELGRQALSTGKFPRAARRAKFLSRMAGVLASRHQVARTYDRDLEEAVQLHREALKISPSGDVSHCNRVYSLARILVVQFITDGDFGQLEEAYQLYHQASHIIDEESPWRPMIISGFAQCLGLRFMETRDISDLNRALDLDVEAVAAWRGPSFNHAEASLQMVSHLCLRFEMLQGHDDLEKAITVAEGLSNSLPDGDIGQLEAIHVLAKARLLHATSKGGLGDIDLAIAQLSSVKSNLFRTVFSPESLRTLAACYLVKFRRSSLIDHAFQAKDVINEVLERVDQNHYERFQCLISAAELYLERGTPYYNIDIALKHLSDALSSSPRDVRSKVRGAGHVLNKMEIEKQDIFTTKSSTSLKLLDILASVVLLLPRIAFFGIHPYSRLQSLKEGQSFAMTGASHALNLSLPEKALEIIEQGRAIFWTHALRLRSPFDEIPEDIRGRLIGLARRLDKVTNASEHSMDQQYVEREIEERRKESEEFISLLGRVRCLPGLERFMLPDEYATLKGVATKGHVVILVCSRLACHAIVLETMGRATSIPLKEVTDKWLMDSALIWRSTVIQTRLRMRNERKLVKSKKTLDSRYTQAQQILDSLWVHVVWPVIEALRIKVCFIILCLKY